MHTLDYSRHHARTPGEEFRDIVDLPGWEDQSIWGYESGACSYFAQLWRNGRRSDEPDHWLSGVDEVYPRPGCIALQVVERTGADPLSAIRSLSLAHPEPRLRSDAAFEAMVAEVERAPRDGFQMGFIESLTWVMGHVGVCPASRWGWAGGRPSPDQVDAEHQMATGRVYLGASKSFFSAVDSSLHWALVRA